MAPGTPVRLVTCNEVWEEERLQALFEPLRGLMDALPILAYRAETVMPAAVAPRQDNPDTGRSLLKALSCSDATIGPDYPAGTLTARLMPHSTRCLDRAVAPCSSS